MSKYAIVIEPGRGSYGAYVPDLPGCVAVGKTISEVKVLIREAIELHVDSLSEHGDMIPKPRTLVLWSVPTKPTASLKQRLRRSVSQTLDSNVRRKRAPSRLVASDSNAVVPKKKKTSSVAQKSSGTLKSRKHR